MPIDEIIVTARRPDPYFTLQRGITGSSQNIPANIGPQVGPTLGSGFGSAGLPAVPIIPVAPPAAPAPLPPPPGPIPNNVIPFPEIRVTAKRPPVFAQTPKLPLWMTGANLAILAAQIGTLWSDYSSQRRLDDQAAGLLLPYTGRPDSPLETIPEPEPIPEIIVTATRADALRNALVMPPSPMFWPYPGISSPGRVAAPLEIPRPNLAPLEIPAPAPLPAPRPAASPGLRPATVPLEWPQPMPGTRVVTQPAQRFAPSPAPSPAPPLTGLRPGSVALPNANPAPVPVAQAQQKCKPCPKKKDKEKRRKKCYKKFVEERAFKRWDREINWQQIDCETGRPV